MQDKHKFMQAMATLGEIFKQEISPILSTAYWHSLKPFSDEECSIAFNKALTSCKFFPKPAELIELIQPTELKQAQAELAWLEVERAVKAHGPYASVCFQDHVINSTIDALGGWVKFQDVHLDEWKWVHKEFTKMYEVMAIRGCEVKYLQGLSEIANHESGFSDDTINPVRIAYIKTDRPVKQLSAGENPPDKIKKLLEHL